MRLIADTNIYISALNYGGPPRAFLRLAASGDFRLALSDEIMDEMVETLRRKFLWPQAKVEEIRGTLSRITERVVPTVILDVVKDDPDDNKILECAHAKGADYLSSDWRQGFAQIAPVRWDTDHHRFRVSAAISLRSATLSYPTTSKINSRSSGAVPEIRNASSICCAASSTRSSLV